MSVAVRVIPCLDVHAGRVVKGVNFVDLRDAGDPVELGAVYDAEGADELTFLDISASSEGRETTLEVVRRTAETVFIPLTVGGGVSSVDDVDTLLRAGADKVAINTGAHPPARGDRRDHPPVRQPGAGPVGRRPPGPGPAVRVRGDHPRRPPSRRPATRSSGPAAGVDLGVGEILLNSMDADGTTGGFDLEMISAVRAVVDVPLIASGGAGRRRGLPARRRRRGRRRAGRHRLPLRHAADRRRQGRARRRRLPGPGSRRRRVDRAVPATVGAVA